MTESTLRRIVETATDPDADVPTLLRLCLVLASQLQDEQLARWANAELDGYGDDEEIPHYRVFRAQTCLRAGNPLVGERIFNVPDDIVRHVSRENYEDPERLCTIRLRLSVAQIAHALAKDANLERSLSSKVARAIAPYVTSISPIRAWTIISTGNLAATMDGVRNRVLAFALKLKPELGRVPSEGQDEKISEEHALGEIVRVFHDQQEATKLLKAAHFPEGRIPAFKDAQTFWDRAIEMARNGVLPGGIRPILEQAARMYPHNPGFAACRRE